jgi:putative transcriptional regulator
MTKRAEFWIKGRERLATPYQYCASGLDNIFLLNGVTIEKTSYGPIVEIENLNGLHHAIGLYIIEKDAPLTGAEFRYLRKQMDLTQGELGQIMKTTDQTIANYEKGKTADLGPADPLMRLTYLLHVIPEETRAEVLKQASEHPGAGIAKLPDLPRIKIVQKWRSEKVAA